jgi:hypothetical protein
LEDNVLHFPLEDDDILIHVESRNEQLLHDRAWKIRSAIKNDARAIRKLGNRELRKIDFYTFRYWRATAEYRKYKDFGSVMVLLGHKSLRYVLLYAQLSKNYEHSSDGYIVREASNKAEAKALLEDGFDYVMEKGGVSLFRKLK